MRILIGLLVLGLAGCATPIHNYADDRPPIGVQQPKPLCSSSGGNGAACATAVLENAAIRQATK
ncbi:MAG: hypothetical protein GAK28_02198 [Luteibacter sp.]|uniref:hypothetical protein n=1 Tax=Luteibacter sp. TaxID=1886636 RepID=UPI00137E6268|nr:hypothetical protein [Luteibacter sp.]KAF1006879.1 MAG: hypothetical protein GAK28_02198 [Luteibacter sp.]